MEQAWEKDGKGWSNDQSTRVICDVTEFSGSMSFCDWHDWQLQKSSNQQNSSNLWHISKPRSKPAKRRSPSRPMAVVSQDVQGHKVCLNPNISMLRWMSKGWKHYESPPRRLEECGNLAGKARFEVSPSDSQSKMIKMSRKDSSFIPWLPIFKIWYCMILSW